MSEDTYFLTPAGKVWPKGTRQQRFQMANKSH